MLRWTQNEFKKINSLNLSTDELYLSESVNNFIYVGRSSDLRASCEQELQRNSVSINWGCAELTKHVIGSN